MNLPPEFPELAEEWKQQLSERLSNTELTTSIMIAIGVALITFVVVLFFGVWKLRTEVLPSRTGMPRKPRFRKRDKMLFYGRKMLRKVKSFTKNTVGSLPQGRGKMKNKQLVLKLAKKLLQMRRQSAQPQLRHKEPPQSFLETDSSEIEESDHRLPPEVLYMLRSTRVFGHFEKPLFLELVKHMETKNLSQGSYLFKPGDQDDSIYVVQSGKLKVTIRDQDTDWLVKYVTTGESVHSLLSILDCLTGHLKPYKTVSAKAAMDTVVLRLPALAFQSLFERFPESLVRVVQIIMIRLQRVTFTALHNYLGLSSELLKSQYDSPNLLSISSISNPGMLQTSPRKHRGSVISTDNEKSAPDVSKISKLSVDNNVEKVRSDFDTACMRARVENKASSELIEEGTPPVKIKISSETKSQQSVVIQEITDDVILGLAKKDLINILKLENETLLDDKLRVRRLKGGQTLIKQGDQDASLTFVVCGGVYVLQQMIGDEKKETLLFVANPGEIVGSLAVLTGEPSFFTFRVKVDTIVVTISKTDFYSIMREQPSVVLNVAHTMAVRIAPFVRQIDFALDWMMIEAGKPLFRQGDQSDSVYIILTGRLRSVRTHQNGKKSLVAEYGRGELVGIVEVLTESARTTTIIAVRDTECAHLPAELLNLIKRKYPQIVTRLIHLLGQRILGHIETRGEAEMDHHVSGIENKVSVGNLATIAVLASSKDVPLTSFTLELQHSLRAIGETTRLTSEIVIQNLGSAALDSINEFRLFNWLGQQEDMNIMTLYQCDYAMTKWTKHCIRQADCILIVALADQHHAVGEVEKQMENIAVRAQKELILLHKEDAESPRGTIEWLNARGWCSSHHHIRCPKRVLRNYSDIKKLTDSYLKIFETVPDRLSDFSRLARFLTGTSIGLVLGGGGARGLSHVGIVKALTEANVPIDMVGGTSMGSFIGAVWCEDRNITRFTQRCREWSMEMTSIWKKVLDLTYPITSMFTGRAFNNGIEKTFKDRQIEDLWIPYFCITTDITNSSMRIHTHGNLWRYVRASMSLSGYLPPLCDPVDAHYLLDGGYVNNLPADVMKQLGGNTIFAVDVGSQDSQDVYNYGDQISGWWLLANKWSPWSETVKVPDMAEIQSRLAYVSCVRQLDHVKNCDYCEYIRPPIDKYATLQFGSFDEIADVGYQHGKALLNGWIKGGLVDELFKPKSGHRKAFKDKPLTRVQTMAQPSMAKFTDLAELVSKIEEPSPSSNVSQSSSSFETDDDEINEVLEVGDDDDDDDDEYEDEEDEDDDIDIDAVIGADIEEEKEDDLSGDDNKELSIGASKSDGSLRQRLTSRSDQSS